MIAKTLGALVLTALFLGHNREAPLMPSIDVNCDAGGDLAAVLQRVDNTPGATILIGGTCVGNFVLSADNVRLRGVSPTESMLVAPEDGASQPVLDVRGAEGVSVSNLGLRGGTAGVRFFRSPGGNVLESELDGNEVGVYLEESQAGRVWRCNVHDNEFGVLATRHSRVGVTESMIRDNSQTGLIASEHSTLNVGATEITGSGESGIKVRTVSELYVSSSTLAQNGSVHLFADDRSMIRVLSSVTVGAGADSTPEAVVVDDNSTFFAGTATYFGDIRVWGGSYAELGNVLQGTVKTEQFSRTLVFNTELTVPATCASGGDLVCSGNATATAVDCPSAPGSCAASPTAATR